MLVWAQAWFAAKKNLKIIKSEAVISELSVLLITENLMRNVDEHFRQLFPIQITGIFSYGWDL